ncbi:hypothetical protein MKX73_19740 [Solibacillus sp. FSL W7-1436]|uniref:hypothetical protein n=1 Tax=Solibacillus sp. FSL W7-1436 TaxID=2921705 RepID=UPI0030F57B49
MSKFQWLKDYQELEQGIAYLEMNLERSRNELERWVNGDLAKYKLTAESDGAKLEERIAAIEYELAHKVNDLQDMKNLISSFGGLENQIIYKKYIEGMTLEKIAEDLNYSAQYIYNKHSQIKRMVSFAERYVI